MDQTDKYRLMTGVMLARRKMYLDLLNDTVFYCDSAKGSLLTDPVWKVTKIVSPTLFGVPTGEQSVTTTANYSNRIDDL